MYFIELLGLDGGQRVLLRIDGAVLQREVDLGKGNWGGVGTTGLGHGGVGGCVGHADFQPLHLVTILEGLVAGGVAHAVVGEGCDLVAVGGFFVTLSQLLEDVALGVLQHVVGIAEGERVVVHRQAGEGARGKRRTGQDDVHGAELEALVDVAFLAQAGGRKHLDFVAAIGALLEFLTRPDRPFVVGLGRFVHVGPFELGLGIGNAHRAHGSGGQ